MPTGGVAPTVENLTGWFNAGVTCVGMGSKLIRKDLLAKQAYDEIRDLVVETLAIVERIRN